MVSKIVTKIGKYVAKKATNETLKNVFDTYDYISDRISMGARPLNVGEDEEMACYRQYPHDTARCKAIGDKIRYDYNHPWKSKRK